jgi:hypothetical protein
LVPPVEQSLEFAAYKTHQSSVGDGSSNAKNSHLRLWSSLDICELFADNARHMSLHKLQTPNR